jgi:hypothetical protein
MKKILGILVVGLLISCSQDEQTQNPLLDCNCNRVVEVLTMNVVAGNGGVGVTKMYKYTTINDCSGIQRESGWSTQSVSVGQCK